MTAHTPKTPNPTRWRQSAALMASERASYYARRTNLSLEVVLYSSGIVTARVVRVIRPEGRHETAAESRWPVTISDTRLVDAAIDVAKRWCESEADRLAAAPIRAKSPVNSRAVSGEKGGAHA